LVWQLFGFITPDDPLLPRLAEELRARFRASGPPVEGKR
jgi:hypothetical protein